MKHFTGENWKSAKCFMLELELLQRFCWKKSFRLIKWTSALVTSWFEFNDGSEIICNSRILCIKHLAQEKHHFVFKFSVSFNELNKKSYKRFLRQNSPKVPTKARKPWNAKLFIRQNVAGTQRSNKQSNRKKGKQRNVSSIQEREFANQVFWHSQSAKLRRSVDLSNPPGHGNCATGSDQ